MDADTLSKRKMMEKQFFRSLKIHEDGSLTLWNVPIMLFPTNTMCSYYILMMQSKNKDVFEKLSYDVGRLQGLTSVKMMNKFFGIKNPKELLDSLTMQSSFMGLGIMSIIKFDEKNASFIISNKTNPLAKECLKIFGKQEDPIDHYFAGLFCGTFSELLEKDLLCLETECIAKGDKACLFEVKPLNSGEKNKGMFTHKELTDIVELKKVLKK